MSTRSFVGVMVGDVCRAVYVHSDGYLNGVGKELVNYYNNQKSVEKLIESGDRSYLTGGFYKDRGEKGVAPSNFKTFKKFFKTAEQSWAEYYYIFKDGVCYFGDTYKGSKYYKKLTPVLIALDGEDEEYEDDDC